MGLLVSVLMGGTKAPYWRKSIQWLTENVKGPVDYIVINYDQLKIDCMERGLNSLWNCRRETLPKSQKTRPQD